MEGLLESYVAFAKSTANAEAALVLAAAAVELLRAHALLADHAVSLGYTNALLKLLSTSLSAAPAGSSSHLASGLALLADLCRCSAVPGV